LALEIAMNASGIISTVTRLMGPLTELYQQQKATSSHPLKPALAIVREYESAVYEFRDQRLPGPVKGVSELLVESVDAFEAGRVLDAGRAVMLALEQFEAAGKESSVIVTPEQAQLIGQFRTRLFKMVVPSAELRQKRIDL